MFVVLLGLGIGALASYASRSGRNTYGVLLVPAVGGAVTAIVWVALLWLGWSFDGGWIWVVSLALGALAALTVAVSVPRKRVERDHALLTQLSSGKA
jgi:hypothetical protein